MAKIKIVTMESLEEAPIDEIVEMEAGGNDYVCNLNEEAEHSRRIEELSAGIDEGKAVIATLESINRFIDGAKLSPSSIRAINPALTHMLKRIGYRKPTKIALEAFGKLCSREEGTKLVMEFLVDAIVWIWEAIVNAFKKLWGWITDFFAWLFGSSKKEEARVTTAIKEADAAAKVIKEETKKNKLLGPFDVNKELLLPEEPYSLYLSIADLSKETDYFFKEVPNIFKGLDSICKYLDKLSVPLAPTATSPDRASILQATYIEISEVIQTKFMTSENTEAIDHRFPQLEIDQTENISHANGKGGMAVYPFNKFGFIHGDQGGLSSTEAIEAAKEETIKVNAPDANGKKPANPITIEPVYYFKPVIKSKFAPNNGRDVYVSIAALPDAMAKAFLLKIKDLNISKEIENINKKINKIEDEFKSAFGKIKDDVIIQNPDIKSYGEAIQNLFKDALLLTSNISNYVNTTSSHLTTYFDKSIKARLEYTVNWEQQELDKKKQGLDTPPPPAP